MKRIPNFCNVLILILSLFLPFKAFAQSPQINLVTSRLIGGPADPNGSSLKEDEGGRIVLFSPTGKIYFGGSGVSGTPTPNGWDQSYNGHHLCPQGSYCLGDSLLGRLSSDASTLEVATFLGGPGSERPCYKMIELPNGDIVCVGHTESPTFPVVDSFGMHFTSGKTDAYISVFNSDLTMLKHSALLGGDGDNTWRGDLQYNPATNQLIACGATASRNLGTRGGQFTQFQGGYNDAFVLISSIDLSTKDEAFYWGSNHASPTEVMTGCHVSPPDNLIFAWTSPSTSFVNSLNPTGANSSNGNSVDNLVTKISNLNGVHSVDWTSMVAKPGTNTTGFAQGEAGMVCDANENCYVTGHTNNDNRRTVGTPYQGGTDCYLAKLNSGGTEWVRYFGGSNNETCYSPKIDLNGNIVIVGNTNSDDLIGITANALQSSYSGNGDIFIASVSADGNNVIYLSYYGGSGKEESRYINMRADGVRWAIIGESNSSDLPNSPDNFHGGFTDILIVLIDNLPGSPYSPPQDAGVADLGHDAGVDIGHDAGVDLGLDAGIDLGVDTGMPDAGFAFQLNFENSSECNSNGTHNTICPATGLGGTNGSIRFHETNKHFIGNQNNLSGLLGSEFWFSVKIKASVPSPGSNFTVGFINLLQLTNVTNSNKSAAQRVGPNLYIEDDTLYLACDAQAPVSLDNSIDLQERDFVLHWNRSSGNVEVWKHQNTVLTKLAGSESQLPTITCADVAFVDFYIDHYEWNYQGWHSGDILLDRYMISDNHLGHPGF